MCQAKKVIKYMGVMLDSKLTFGEQILRVADKAAALTMMLSRIMAYVHGLRSCKRYLLMCTADSMMFYGAEGESMRCDLKNIASVSCLPTARYPSSRYS